MVGLQTDNLTNKGRRGLEVLSSLALTLDLKDVSDARYSVTLPSLSFIVLTQRELVMYRDY